MNALVELRHAEPMTTSLVVAEGVTMEHKSVIQLVRHHVEHLEDFGPIAFEMRKGTPLPQGGYSKPTEFAWLNEGQSLFLLTLMRNSPVVVEFKKALIRAFLELRDRARAAAVPSREEPLTLSHRADVMVAADRTFRAAWRTARAAGLPTARAIRTANRIAHEKTGVNLLAELDAEEVALDPAPEATAPDPHGVAAFMYAWFAGELPVPVMPCRSSDLYRAYRRWCAAAGREPCIIHRFHPAIPAELGMARSAVQVRLIGSDGSYTPARVVVPPGARTAAGEGVWGRHVALCVQRFAAALAHWDSGGTTQ